MGRRPTDKRQRLIDSAVEKFHENGYDATSLATIAQASAMSTGNVFYFFKTKAELAEAVIEEWCVRLSGYTQLFESETEPRRRIERFIEQADALRTMYATVGCPLAGLTRDLRRQTEPLRSSVARIYAVQYQWLEKQFVLTGLSREAATKLSRFVMAELQGAILLAYAQNDDRLITEQVNRLKDWLRDKYVHGQVASCT